jgi:hypothetical protein
LQPVDPDRLGDVFELLIAEILKSQRQLVADVIARCGRNTNRARLGEAFQPRGDVDPVTEQIGTIDQDIADMHADTEQHRLIGSTARSGLHRDRALYGIDRAGEVGDDAVSGGVEDAAAV